MKINSLNAQSPNFGSGLYNNKALVRMFEFASDNSALYCAGVSLVLSTAARPLAILNTPKADIQNKKYAAAKSIASSITGYILMFLISNPVSKAIKNIDNNPSKYLSKDTIENLKNGAGSLSASKKYQFATQLFKLGLGLVIALPKSEITSFLIPKIMDKFQKIDDNKKEKRNNNNEEKKDKNIVFKGSIYNKMTNNLSKGISSLINTKKIQNLSEKFYKTNFEQNIMYLTDIVLTGAFVNKTIKNKKIDEKRKKPLIYNSILSTVFSMISSLFLNKMLEKPFENFISKLKEANKDSPKLHKYIEGANIAKISLIMGGVYYILIPVFSTFFADKIDKYKNRNNDNLIKKENNLNYLKLEEFMESTKK